METLAHHTENPEEWIRLINQIDGLIHLAAYEAIGELDAQSVYGGNVDVSTKEQVRQILYVLIRVYESLRQVRARFRCYTDAWSGSGRPRLATRSRLHAAPEEDHLPACTSQRLPARISRPAPPVSTFISPVAPAARAGFPSAAVRYRPSPSVCAPSQCSSGGYITSQLTHRYNKASRDNLRKEWNEYQRSLVHEVGEHVLSITTHARSFAVGKLSPTETVLLSKMMNLHHSDGSIAPPGFDYGAIGYRVRSFQARSTKPPPWMIAPKPTKAVLFTAMRVSGLPNPRDGADGPQLAISVHTPDGKTSTGRSLSAAHKMDPMWSNECLELELGNVADETSAIAADCTVQVDVLRPSRHGSTHCLGTVSFKMRATAGRFEGELLDPNGKQTSSRLYVSYQSPHAVTN